MTWHVVCHGCGFETIEDAPGDADAAAVAHHDETSHSVSYGRIDGPGTTDATRLDGAEVAQ